MRKTITISRQFGSGGSYVGQLIAKRLGLRYVDREVLHLAAQEFGCTEEAVAAREERIASFWERILSGLTFGPPEGTYTPPPLRNFTDKELFERQTEILKRIAAREDCVIIGWAGARLLPRHPGMFTIFCHAPVDFRVRRVMELYGTGTQDAARAMLKESDEMRRRYFKAMTGSDWACAEDYDLSIDTSIFPLEKVAEIVVGLLKLKGVVA